MNMTGSTAPSKRVVIVGAGPAGLFAAERLAVSGIAVDVYDHMPGPARKLLLAGRGGLNLTHSEPLDRFVTRYGPGQHRLAAMIGDFPPEHLRQWAAGLGIETFVGSSGRVFPVGLKASHLVRAWMRRLEELGVRLHRRRRWIGFAESGTAMRLIAGDNDGHDGEEIVSFDAALLALGGASWPRTGSDGTWPPLLERAGVAIAPLQPANVGLRIDWPPGFAQRFAGSPVKPAALAVGTDWVRGEFVVTHDGIEGGPVYSLVPAIRHMLDSARPATVRLDLKPAESVGDLVRRLERPRGRLSVGPFVRRSLSLSDVAYALLVAFTPRAVMDDSVALAHAIKGLSLPVANLAPIHRAISSAGGVRLDDDVPGADDSLMLKALPGVFVAGEMLDWEAPTGGYLLQACFATAAHAAKGMAAYLGQPQTLMPPAGDP